MGMTDAERAAAAAFVKAHPKGGRALAAELGVPVPESTKKVGTIRRVTAPAPEPEPIRTPDFNTIKTVPRRQRQRFGDPSQHPKLLAAAAAATPKKARGKAGQAPTVYALPSGEQTPSLTSLLADIDPATIPALAEPTTLVDKLDAKLLEILQAPSILDAEAVEPEVAAEPPLTVAEQITREAWMLRAVEELRPWFGDTVVPPVRISFGWPGGRGSSRALGQCWMPAAVADKVPAIFISPRQGKPVEVLDTILHEMVHAAGASGHAGAFAKIAKVVGLKAPWTSTPIYPELEARLQAVADKLGPLTHGTINASDTVGSIPLGPNGKPVVQSTRMVKLTCGSCGYTVRATRKWISVGLPSCPTDGEDLQPSAKDLAALIAGGAGEETEGE